MKIIITILCLLFPVVASAQNQGMQGLDMGQLMQAMQEVQQCMAQVDKQELNALEQRTKEMEAEIDTLCKKGKRDKAQKRAIAFSKEMMNNPALVQMKKCGEITKGMIPEGSMPEESMGDQDYDFDPSKGNVCDDR